MAISKETYDALPDEAKSHFIESGEGYDIPKEDVEGLKKKRDELLKDLKSKTDILKQFEGLNPEEARKALSEMTRLEEKKLADKGKYEELLAKHRADYEAQLEKERTEKTAFLSNLKTEKLTNLLTAKGVLPDRAKYALADIAEQIELENKDGRIGLKLKDGIGDAKEIESLIEGLKTQSPFFFAANNASGSGASGSQGNGGASKIMKRAEFEQLQPADSMSFIKSGGSITD